MGTTTVEIDGRGDVLMATGGAIQADRTSEIAIFARLLKADEGNLRSDLARYLLTLGFDEEDQGRMRDLARRNQEGASPRRSETNFAATSRPGTCSPCSTPRPGDR